MPSDDTFKLKEDSATAPTCATNKKLNVGVVKEQVGVAFTYPNIHLSAWFLESSDLATAVRITEGLLY